MVDRLRPGGTVIASVPNVSHWYPRGRVAIGRFDYDQRGILDATHLRFFTRRSFLRMAHAAGLEPVEAVHTGLPFDALGATGGHAVGAVAGADRALVRADLARRRHERQMVVVNLVLGAMAVFVAFERFGPHQL